MDFKFDKLNKNQIKYIVFTLTKNLKFKRKKYINIF